MEDFQITTERKTVKSKVSEPKERDLRDLSKLQQMKGDHYMCKFCERYSVHKGNKSKCATKWCPSKEDLGEKIEIDLSDTKYRTLFVGSLPNDLNLDEFQTYFEKFGKLDKIKPFRHFSDTNSGFINYDSYQSVYKVLGERGNH